MASSSTNNTSPNSPERRIDAAEGYLMLEMPEQAMRELRAVEARVRPDDDLHVAIARCRGEACRQQEDFEEALSTGRRSGLVDTKRLTCFVRKKAI